MCRDLSIYIISWHVFFFQIENRGLVCRTFQRAVVQNQELTRSQSETLVLFLMDNHTELFKVHFCFLVFLILVSQTCIDEDSGEH